MSSIENELNNFLVYLKKELNYSNNTVQSYTLDINKFFEYLENNNLIYNKITKEDIRNYLKLLSSNELSSKTISRNISSLRFFYEFLKEVNVINDNIFLKINNPKVSSKLPNYLSTNELEDILNSIAITDFFKARNYLLIEMIYSTGLRLNEVINIKLKDINIDEKIVKVMGKGSKERIACIGEYALEGLNIYITKYRCNYALVNNPYLFISKNGTQLSKSMANKIIKTTVASSGIKKNISAHTLRHTFATDLLNEGASIETVKELLGHSSLNTTQIYTHVSNEKMRETYLKAHPRNKG